MNFACISGATDAAPQEDEDEEFSYEPKKVEEEGKEEVTQCEENIQEEKCPTVEDEEKIVVEDENVYEPVLVSDSIIQDSPEEMKIEEDEREDTPDPLKRIAAQLHGQLQGYKADFDKFSNLMEEHKPTESPPEPTVTEPERKLSREEEISLVKTMSKQEAWSHVMSQVYEVKTKFQPQLSKIIISRRKKKRRRCRLVVLTKISILTWKISRRNAAELRAEWRD